MEFKGTKGVWMLCSDDSSYITPPNEEFAISKAFQNGFITKEESEANAKLIAAAPELLESLKETLSYLRSFNQWEEAEEMLAFKIDALIKKATE